MRFTIKGKICGQLCGNCQEPLATAELLVYSANKSSDLTDKAMANPKHTVHIRDEKSVKSMKKHLIGKAKCDENGEYKVQLDKAYQGGPIDIDLRIDQVPHAKQKVKKTVQIHLTTTQPQWREGANDLYFGWDYCLSQTLWCAIRAMFDAWVICGHIRVCDENNAPVSGVKVSAFDADWLTDDFLGTATTDSSGRFRIDYSSKDFKQTFLSPIINVETPFSNLLGPDVYFKIESGTSIIYEEHRADGQVPGRRDISNCFCVDLCVKVDVGPNPEPIASAWTGIGTEATIPVGVDTNDFDAEGCFGPQKYGFSGTIRTTGQVAISSTNKALRGNPYEYRFLVSDSVTGTNGESPLADSLFSETSDAKIVGVDLNTFAPIKIGQMWYTGSPFKVVDVEAHLVDLDAKGWLDANKSVLRTFTDDSTLDPNDLTNPATADLWHWIDLDGMMGIKTQAFTDSYMPTVATPGEAVLDTDKKAIEKIAIRFELREVVDKAAGIFNYLSGSGQTLNAMVVNNTPALAKVTIAQHLTSTDCSALTGTVGVAFTAYHPLLHNVNVNVRSNDGSIEENLSGAGLPLSGNTDSHQDQRHSENLSITGAPNSLVLHTCTYMVDLRLDRRLHNGDYYVGQQDVPDRAFYYTA